MTKIVFVVKMKFLWFHGGADLHIWSVIRRTRWDQLMVPS